MAQDFTGQRYYFRNSLDCAESITTPTVGCFMYWQLSATGQLDPANLAAAGYYSDGTDIFRVDANGQVAEVGLTCDAGGGGGGTGGGSGVTWTAVTLFYGGTNQASACAGTARTVSLYMNASDFADATALARNADGTNPPGGGYYAGSSTSYSNLYLRQWVLNLNGGGYFNSSTECSSGQN